MAQRTQRLVAVAGFVFAAVFPVPAAAQPPALTGDLQVNTTTTNRQTDPSVCTDESGNFVVTWEGDTDGDFAGIFGQRFDSDGAPIGGEFQVNSYTPSLQGKPSVCCGDNGEFVVVWVSNQYQGSFPPGGPSFAFDVKGQRFDSNGLPAGTEFLVSANTTFDQVDPDICCQEDGTFVVVWSHENSSFFDILGQRFQADGDPDGPTFQVNTYTTDEQRLPALCCREDGSFVVVWESEGTPDGDLSGIFGQRFAAGGAPAGAEFLVNSYTQSAQEQPAICCDTSGSFVVAWESFDHDGHQDGIFAQRFDANAQTAGPLFQVNTYTPNSQTTPAVCCGEDGSFAIAWTDAAYDGFGNGVFAQSFAAGGAPVGAQFQVNTYTPDDQSRPDIACTADGFVLAWDSIRQDGSDLGVFAKVYGTDDVSILEIPALDRAGLMILAALLAAAAWIVLRRT